VTQAVILAGGKGTRLATLLQGKPKCLVDVDGIPLLQRQITLLKEHGIHQVILLVNYAADQVEAFLAAHASFGVRVTVIDDGEPRGTAGAVLAALDTLGDRFVVLYGDTLLNVDLSRLIATHAQSEAEATLFLHPNDHPADSDLVELDDAGWVRAFHPYPHAPGRYYPNLVNAALYVLEKRALTPWRGVMVPSDFGKDLFPAMLADGAKLRGYASFEYIKDIGTPARLEKAVNQLRRGVVGRASFGCRQKAVFLDRDGTLNIHRGFVRSADALELYPHAGEAVRRLNDNEFRAVVITNQPVLARGEATFEDLRGTHAKLEMGLAECGAFLDAIYFCPHHPDRGFPGEVPFLKIDCDCRKPKIGLINQAARDINIDLEASWFIGDTTSDLETAQRAGVRSILVLTGEAGRDDKYQAEPDFVADDLAGAVDIILSGSHP